jgi:hypothetical protein
MMKVLFKLGPWGLGEGGALETFKRLQKSVGLFRKYLAHILYIWKMAIKYSTRDKLKSYKVKAYFIYL